MIQTILTGLYAGGFILTTGLIYYCKQYDIITLHGSDPNISEYIRRNTIISTVMNNMNKLIIWPCYYSRYENKFMTLYSFFENGEQTPEATRLFTEIRNTANIDP